MGVKNKILLVIASILTVFSVAFFYFVKIQQNENLNALQVVNFETTKVSFENISKKYYKHYTDIVLHEFSSIEFKKAFLNRDKELLYKLLSEKYKIFKKNNESIVLMNLHSPNNIKLLDMNNPDATKEINSSIMVTKVHKSNKSNFGYEQDKDYLVYKSIHPIFYDQNYIGALEIGVDIRYILDDMKNFAGIDGVLYTQSSSQSSLNFNSKTTKDMDIVDAISNSSILENIEVVSSRRGKSYGVYTFDIKNAQQLTIARFHFTNNITEKIIKFEDDLNTLIIAIASMIIITLVTLNFSLRRSVKTIQESFDNLYEYTDMIDNNIMIVDVSADFIITGVSQRFCDISGYTKDELIGKDFQTLKDPSTPDEVYNDMHDELEKNGKWSGDLQNRAKDGHRYWLSTKIEAKYRDGKLICYDYIMHNITARKMNEELLYVDELTGLFNRKYFNDIFPRMVKGIKRNGGCINFIVLDIDDFKRYNEIYGHEKGDEALIAISKKLQESLRRPDDYCVRLGGGEFGILYRSSSEDEGNLYAQVLRKNIEMVAIRHEANVVHKVLTASLGLVSLDSHKIDTYQDIYKRSYEHLARAKADGRNKVVSKLI